MAVRNAAVQASIAVVVILAVLVSPVWMVYVSALPLAGLALSFLVVLVSPVSLAAVAFPQARLVTVPLLVALASPVNQAAVALLQAKPVAQPLLVALVSPVSPVFLRRCQNFFPPKFHANFVIYCVRLSFCSNDFSAHLIYLSLPLGRLPYLPFCF